MSDIHEGAWHVGRSFAGTRIEDDCPCGKAPCGLADDSKFSQECEHHPFARGRTVRQAHSADRCPGSAHDAEMAAARDADRVARVRVEGEAS